MKHTEDRDARRARQAADGFPDFKARSRVKIAQRLVEQEELRPKGERPGQIAFLCECVGLQVEAMKRIRIGRVTMSSLSVGQWRYLLPHEKF